jgi:hypothetical protein
MPIEDIIGEVMPENFTLTERTELIRHGIQLEQLNKSVEDLKYLFNATLERAEADDKERTRTLKVQDADNEKRIRSLEDEALKFKTQLKTFLGIASLIGAAVGVVVHIVLHFVWPIK